LQNPVDFKSAAHQDKDKEDAMKRPDPYIVALLVIIPLVALFLYWNLRHNNRLPFFPQFRNEDRERIEALERKQRQLEQDAIERDARDVERTRQLNRIR
jgi:hypothetical protein